MHPDYHSIADTFNDWRRHEWEDFAPTARQAAVIAAVHSALAAGLFYTVDVRRHCAEFLAITPEVEAFRPRPVEGGAFGMDCYYARCYLDAQRKHKDEREAHEAMRLAVGDKLGALLVNCKLTRACRVEAIDGRDITFAGSRGTSKVQGTATALQLRYAIERAHERKNRRESYAEFCARTHNPAPKPDAVDTTGKIACDGGWSCCNHMVSMIGNKGYAYCEPCGITRRHSNSAERVRKLTASELHKLQAGEPLQRY